MNQDGLFSGSSDDDDLDNDRPFRRRFVVPRRYCTYCGKEDASQIDHIIAQSLGGPDEEWNRCSCCGDCNQKKSDQKICDWISGQKRVRHRELRELFSQEMLRITRILAVSADSSVFFKDHAKASIIYADRFRITESEHLSIRRIITSLTCLEAFDSDPEIPIDRFIPSCDIPRWLCEYRVRQFMLKEYRSGKTPRNDKACYERVDSSFEEWAEKELWLDDAVFFTWGVPALIASSFYRDVSREMIRGICEAVKLSVSTIIFDKNYRCPDLIHKSFEVGGLYGLTSSDFSHGARIGCTLITAFIALLTRDKE